jgi:hypothetical protein
VGIPQEISRRLAIATPIGRGTVTTKPSDRIGVGTAGIVWKSWARCQGEFVYVAELWFWWQFGEEELTEMIRCCQTEVILASKLTEDVRGQLTSRIALHYFLPELNKAETEAILRHTLGVEVTDEMIDHIHQLTGGIFRSVDMIIPRILELEQRNRQKLADGTIKMNEIIKVAAARLMI